MDLSQIWAECGRLLNDPNNERWIQSVLTFRANQAQTIIQGYTKSVKTKELVTPTANVSQVTVDTDAMDILRVTLTKSDGNIKIIEGISREELDYRYPNWPNLDPGEPNVYWFDATNSQINLIPAPSSQYALTDALSVWEIQRPTDLSSSSDVPFSSNTQMVPYHLAIVHWVVAQCWIDEGTSEALGKSRFHRSGLLERPGEFEKQIMRITNEFDNPTDVPARILWRPQGGRLGRTNRFNKSDPLGLS